jgi:hypothetical protein
MPETVSSPGEQHTAPSLVSERNAAMPGLLRGIARTAVVAGTATAVSGRVARRQQGRWAAQEAQQAAQAAPPAAEAVRASTAAPSPDSNTMLAQLTQLGELRASGVLTDAEFDTQKARILNS